MGTASLRELGGDGSQYDIEGVDQKVGSQMNRVLSSSPEEVVAIAMDTNHELHSALSELLTRNVLTTAQYGILGDMLISKREHADRNRVLGMIVDRTSSLITGQVYEALGWNTYPDDEDGSLNVVV